MSEHDAQRAPSEPDKYKTIVADPPWDYEGFASMPGTPGEAARKRGVTKSDVATVTTPLPYPSLSVDEIAALPLGALAADDCRLFLWTTNRYLPASFGVLSTWGFEYRQTIVWHKTGNPSPFGGSVAPNHAEFLLVGTKGNPPRLDRAPSNVLPVTGKRKHSAKPEVFLDLIEKVSPGPYLELFARRNRLGWDTWGNEALNHVAALSPPQKEPKHSPTDVPKLRR